MDPQAVSHRPLIGSLVVLIKRLARKSIRWYVAPQIEQARSQITNLERCVAELLRRDEMRAREWQVFHAQQNVGALEEMHSRLAELRAGWETTAAAISGKLAHQDARIESLVANAAAEENAVHACAATLTNEIARLHHRLADLDAERIAFQKAVHSRSLLPDHSFNTLPEAHA
jgi:hypothetical protein